jgi:hypothetical protein
MLQLPRSSIDGRDALLAVGVNSLACLPLKVDNTPVGSFLFGVLARGAMSPDELLLLEEVASNLSFALQYMEKAGRCPLSLLFRAADGTCEARAILRAPESPLNARHAKPAAACADGLRHRSLERHQ